MTWKLLNHQVINDLVNKMSFSDDSDLEIDNLSSTIAENISPVLKRTFEASHFSANLTTPVAPDAASEPILYIH